MKINLLRFTFFLFWLLFTSTLSLQAQPAQVLTLTNESLANDRKVELENWKYQFGDDVTWANPQFEDAGWKNLKDADYADWRGIMWARLNISIAPELEGVPLNLEMQHTGASEIYLDGKLIGGYGTVGRTLAEEQTYNPNFVPLSITFKENGKHLIAIRYSNQSAADVHSVLGALIKKLPGGIGFQANLARFGDATNIHNFTGLSYSYWLIQFTICLVIGVLHLLLFAFYPRQRGNLYYGLFLLTLMINDVLIFPIAYAHSAIFLFVFSWAVVYAAFAVKLILLLAFLYTAFEKRIPPRIWILVVGFAIWYFLHLIPSDTIFAISNLLYLMLSLGGIFESARIVITAWRKKIDGAWIVVPGVITRGLISVTSFFAYVTASFIISENLYAVLDFIGTYGLIVSVSIYLARDFAQTNKTLEAQLIKEIEHERATVILRAENERRAKELEEARALQLSMLPKKLPQIPNLEIAAYMKTATEVGGDYYDFHVGKDGTLTVAVGDATGHGLKAGTVVTATKSLFANLAHEPNIPNIFRQTSVALKSMNLRGLFMAMMMLKIKDRQVRLSIAGMPSALIYRAALQIVEEISIRAMPLGSIAKTNYQEKEFALADGDIVVLMSDGFPEMFNLDDEMLGFEKAAEILPQVAHKSPQEIVNQLVKVGEDWANGRPQDDDVTFVVLKIRES